MPLQPQPAGPSNPAAPLTEQDIRYLHFLDDLLDVSASLLRRIQRESEAEPQAPPQPAAPPQPTTKQIVADYDSLSEAVRRNIALARHIRQQPVQAQPAIARPATEKRTVARKRIIREVQDAILREGRTEQAEALYTEFLERLELPDLDEDIATRPIPEIIADICRDLSVVAQPNSRPFARRTPLDIEKLCALAAEPSLPQPDRASITPDAVAMDLAADPLLTNIHPFMRPEPPA